MPLDTNGWQEPQTWQVLSGAFTIAAVVQFAKIYASRDTLPPLRVVFFQSLLAGLAALTIGFLMIDKLTVTWATVFFSAGIVGWLGGDALGLLANIARQEAMRRLRDQGIDPPQNPDQNQPPTKP